MAVIKNITYAAAKATLTEVERDKLLCAYMNPSVANEFHVSTSPPFLSSAPSNPHAQVDVEKAAQAYGTATGNAFRVALQTILKKVKEHGSNDGEATDATTGTVTAETTPMKAKPTSRKRKAADYVGSAEPTPKKARAPRAKKAKAAKQEEVDEHAHEHAHKHSPQVIEKTGSDANFLPEDLQVYYDFLGEQPYFP